MDEAGEAAPFEIMCLRPACARAGVRLTSRLQ